MSYCVSHYCAVSLMWSSRFSLSCIRYRWHCLIGSVFSAVPPTSRILQNPPHAQDNQGVGKTKLQEINQMCSWLPLDWLDGVVGLSEDPLWLIRTLSIIMNTCRCPAGLKPVYWDQELITSSQIKPWHSWPKYSLIVSALIN